MKISKINGKKITKSDFLKQCDKSRRLDQDFYTRNAYDLNRFGSFTGKLNKCK